MSLQPICDLLLSVLNWFRQLFRRKPKADWIKLDRATFQVKLSTGEVIYAFHKIGEDWWQYHQGGWTKVKLDPRRAELREEYNMEN